MALGKIVWHIRRRAWLKRFRRAGANFVFDPSSIILTPDRISVGNDVYIGESAHLSGDITIANNVMIGPRLVVNTGMDIFAVCGMSPRFTKPIRSGFYSPVMIEDEVWIGANAIILGGVTIGIGSVIGAGSVVVRSIPPFTVGVGNPCKPIRKIFTDEVLESHMGKIGYAKEIIRQTIQRRRGDLAEADLPVVDKSCEFAGKIHEVRPR